MSGASPAEVVARNNDEWYSFCEKWLKVNAGMAFVAYLAVVVGDSYLYSALGEDTKRVADEIRPNMTTLADNVQSLTNEIYETNRRIDSLSMKVRYGF